MSKTKAQYGSWAPKITSESIVQKTIALQELIVDQVNGDVYWIESRPLEGGRSVLCKDGKDVVPSNHNVRTRVHEYGGAPALAYDGTLYYANFSDQILYELKPNSDPTPLTKEGYRYADIVMDKKNNRLIAVREDHTDTSKQNPTNTIVSIPLNGSEQQVLASGNDFYSSPRVSPVDGSIAFITWSFPNMPWNNTKVCVLKGDQILQITTNDDEACAEPQWSPDGVLYFVTDRRNGWWNIHFYNEKEQFVQYVLALDNAEFTTPAWVFGNKHYTFKDKDTIVASWSDVMEGGKLALINLNKSDSVQYIKTNYSVFNFLNVSTDGNSLLFLGSSPTSPSTAVRYQFADSSTQVLKTSFQVDISEQDISAPRVIEFQTENNRTAFGNYYAPRNSEYEGLDGELPPLLVQIHGGPTAQCSTTFNKKIQYWTNRGFAILDVNYGGSTGYGREYRNRLDGNWGIVDVDDCCNGALHLVKQGLADSKRLVIDGGSAGGYTTLACLAFRKVFSAGASHYGVSDLEALASDTHKFESRYMDLLIGAYPAQKSVYVERSPIHHLEGFAAPLALFQGDEDKIVPPNQAEMIYKQLLSAGKPVSYTLFKGEQHGFRQAENIRRALDGEFYFYSKVFGFKTAEDLEGKIKIDNIE
ncbi:dipeptidyl peptidase family protein [Acrasis kona]|uniref:Dipeptidyl peptidase family protein n=1 Tax=Acrasis kona TaxID=1008807 RepID=A0AAW2YHM8_9EUKA